MAIYECNSCHARYTTPQKQSGPYIHVCATEIVTPAVIDANGKVTTPEKREPRPNPRNENRPDGFVVRNGVAMVESYDPHDSTRIIRAEVHPDIIVSEGEGRTLIAP